ncbi:MAG TPA: DUF2243 domain-containing protein [Thermoanaerobaculia bacterium]|nr:DUF2243 domain-containing protein [Thermoanaerobaculia bacterium]
MSERDGVRPVTTAGTILGIGLGGFFDGIVFHQILQVHNMLTARIPKTTIPNIEVNMFWDGLFHAVTWTATVVGLFMLWNAVRRPGVLLSTRAFVGSLLFGWGLFNVVEGLIDHQLLGIHHVLENAANHLPADLAFLAWGAIMLVIGWSMMRPARYTTRAATRS